MDPGISSSLLQIKYCHNYEVLALGGASHTQQVPDFYQAGSHFSMNG